MDETRTVHAIPCEDAVDRKRALQVWGTPGRLSFRTPPGEVAHVHPRDYEVLRQAMRDSLVEACREPERRPAEDRPTAEPQPPQRGSAGAEDEHTGTAVPGSGTLGSHSSSRSNES